MMTPSTGSATEGASQLRVGASHPGLVGFPSLRCSLGSATCNPRSAPAERDVIGSAGGRPLAGPPFGRSLRHSRGSCLLDASTTPSPPPQGLRWPRVWASTVATGNILILTPVARKKNASGPPVAVLKALLGRKSGVETWDNCARLMGDEDDRSRAVIDAPLSAVGCRYGSGRRSQQATEGDSRSKGVHSRTAVTPPDPRFRRSRGM
jgi:hypothetical protein